MATGATRAALDHIALVPVAAYESAKVTSVRSTLQLAGASSEKRSAASSRAAMTATGPRRT
jgi:hypothetical protein